MKGTTFKIQTHTTNTNTNKQTPNKNLEIIRQLYNLRELKFTIDFTSIYSTYFHIDLFNQILRMPSASFFEFYSKKFFLLMYINTS